MMLEKEIEEVLKRLTEGYEKKMADYANKKCRELN